jgi:hypothetical protein
LAFNATTLQDEAVQREDQVIDAEEEFEQQSNNRTSSSSTSGCSRMQTIFTTIRSNASVIATQNPKYPDADVEFVALPTASECGNQNDFIFDTTGTDRSTIIDEVQSFSCPPTLEEMMSIVRKLRVQRKNAIMEFEFQDPIVKSGISRSNSNNSSKSTGAKKTRTNNYDKVFA